MNRGEQQVHVGVRVPGTSANLGPGFDALGVALGCHLVAGAVDRGAERVTTTGEGAGEVPTDETNLVWSSFVRFCEAHGADVPDVSLRVENDLPLERGLGSSSAAIVAGLALGRSLTGVPVGDMDLVRLADAIEGHADNVAPAVLGGFVSCATDAGGDLVVRRAQPDPRMTVVVAVPPDRQNTNDGRATLSKTLDRAEVVTQVARAVHVGGALTGTWPIAPGAVGDVLHEPTRLGVLTGSGKLVSAWRAQGLHAWLSGAGPSVAALVPTADAAPRRRAIDLAEEAGFAVRVPGWDLAGAFACAAGQCTISGRPGCATCPRAGLC